jgi:hypothetical protein
MTYFEYIERKPQLDMIEWEDPEEITVVERKLEPDQYEAILRQLEALGS